MTAVELTAGWLLLIIWGCIAGFIVCVFHLVHMAFVRQDEREWEAAHQHAAQMRALAPRRHA